MRLMPLRDDWLGAEDMRLPEPLLMRAAQEREEYGQIMIDTAAALVEAGAELHRLDKVLDAQLALTSGERE